MLDEALLVGIASISAILAWLLFAANGFVLGSLALYGFALCVQLSMAVISFYQLVAAASA